MQFVLVEHHFEVVLHDEADLLAEKGEREAVGDVEKGSDVAKQQRICEVTRYL